MVYLHLEIKQSFRYIRIKLIDYLNTKASLITPLLSRKHVMNLVIIGVLYQLSGIYVFMET